MQSYQAIRPLPPQQTSQSQPQYTQPNNQPRSTSLLNAMPQGQQGAATDIIFVPVSQAPSSSSAPGNEMKGSPSLRWSDAETRYLLAIWKNRLPISKKRNLGVWESISQEFNNKLSGEGITSYRTSIQCKTRIKNLEDEYKRVQREGKDRETFPYYKDFAEIPNIYKDKDKSKPRHVSQPFQRSFDDDDEDDDDDDDDDTDDSDDDDDDDESPPPSLGRHIPPEYAPLTPQQCTEMMLRVQNQAAYDMRAAKHGGYMHPAMHPGVLHDPALMGGLMSLNRATAPPRTRSSKWSDAETRYLLAIWKDRYPISKKRNYKVWESIAKEFNKHMASQGITQYRTGTQCKKRMKTLEDEFKKIKITGRKPESFDYYEDLREVFDLHKAMSGLRYVAKAGFDEDASYHPAGSSAGKVPLGSGASEEVNGSSSKKRKVGEASDAKGKPKEPKKTKAAEERGMTNEALIAYLEESQKRDHEFLKQLSDQEAERDKQSLETIVTTVRDLVKQIKSNKTDS